MCLDRSTLTLSWGEGPRPLPRAHFPLTIFSPKNSFLDRTLQAFQQAKEQLSHAPVLVHYDPELPIRLAGDASQYGIGAVLSHVMPNRSEHPIAFASQTLHKPEKSYT